MALTSACAGGLFGLWGWLAAYDVTDEINPNTGYFGGGADQLDQPLGIGRQIRTSMNRLLKTAGTTSARFMQEPWAWCR
jgi:hypothetical protein